MQEFLLYVLEFIGTVAFAVSGALVAIGAGLDIFGVAFIGCVTAVGGGVLRDMMLGIHPPAAFENFMICFLAIAVSVLVFVIAYVKKNFHQLKMKIEHINNFFDAVGLAAFSVMGAEITCMEGYADNIFLVIIIGMITGIGGGIIRDILTDTTPYVLKKHVYAVASILGCLVYYILRLYLEETAWDSAAAMLVVFGIRMLATKYRWSLPRIQKEKEITE